MRIAWLPCLFLLFSFSNCGLLRQSPKYGFANGKYTSNALSKSGGKVFVYNNEEEIVVYALRKTATGFGIDSSLQKPVRFEKDRSPDVRPRFRETSFDVDFLTIPFKYRFPAEGFPRQFNANLNGAAYLGYRSDVYVLHYPKNIFGIAERKTTHLGFSFGGFTGLGATAMNPWVTTNQINIEYDGMVWTKGIAGIVALNSFTTGLAIGWDHLLDGNRKHWIYQNRPWLGFVFGLNLN